MQTLDIYTPMILEILKTQSPLGTLDLAKKIFGPSGTAAQINPTLYLMRDKLKYITSFDVGNDKYWSLIKRDEIDELSHTSQKFKCKCQCGRTISITIT